MSSRELCIRYLCERFPLRVFVPLAGALVLLGAVAGKALPSLAWTGAACGTVLPLLLALRILDDVVDREHDSVRHPGRITVRAGRVAPLAVLALVAFLVAAGAALGGAMPPGRATIAVGTAGLLAAWYAMRAGLHAGRLVNALVVLLKYPAIVAAIAPPGAAPGLLIPLAATAYLGVLVHDLTDDPDLRRMHGGTT